MRNPWGFVLMVFLNAFVLLTSTLVLILGLVASLALLCVALAAVRNLRPKKRARELTLRHSGAFWWCWLFRDEKSCMPRARLLSTFSHAPRSNAWVYNEMGCLFCAGGAELKTVRTIFCRLCHVSRLREVERRPPGVISVRSATRSLVFVINSHFLS